MALDRQQLAKEHAQSTITAEANDLAVPVSKLRADGMRQSICHAAVAEGTKLFTFAHRGDITYAPHIAHTGIDGKDRILRCFLINDIRNILWVQRRHLLNIGCISINDLGELLVMLPEHLIEEGAVLLFRSEERRVGKERGA